MSQICLFGFSKPVENLKVLLVAGWIWPRGSGLLSLGLTYETTSGMLSVVLRITGAGEVRKRVTEGPEGVGEGSA